MLVIINIKEKKLTKKTMNGFDVCVCRLQHQPEEKKDQQDRLPAPHH
jgi:hypothetical protein